MEDERQKRIARSLAALNAPQLTVLSLAEWEAILGEIEDDDAIDRFRATVYAMNTLLVQKGIYSPEEFEFQFRQFAAEKTDDYASDTEGRKR